MLRFLTAGESHGPQLTVIVEGVPAGLRLDAARRRRRLACAARPASSPRKRRRRRRDRAEIVAGVRGGLTLGSRSAWWSSTATGSTGGVRCVVKAAGFTRKPVSRVRPGHADLAGMLKYGLVDARDVLERASARETAARVAAGAVALTLLGRLGVRVGSWVQRIGDVSVDWREVVDQAAVEASPVRCPDPEASARMVAAVDSARERGDTAGTRGGLGGRSCCRPWQLRALGPQSSTA